MSQGKIPISDAKYLATKHNLPIVLIFGISADGEQFHLTTYGASERLCKHAASLSQQIAEKILQGHITPLPEEPPDLPNQPTQWEGRTP